MITPLQQQALFTLRQALALCDQAHIQVLSDMDGLFYIPHPDRGPLMSFRLSGKTIDTFERLQREESGP